MKKVDIKKEDLDYNINVIKNMISENENKPQIIAVVKSNGMGLDLNQYSNYLYNKGIKFFAVATYEEALELRNYIKDSKILLLSPVYRKEELEELVNNNIILTIGSIKEYQNLNEVVQKLNKNITIHVKIDSGFGRYGFLYDDLKDILNLYELLNNNSLIKYDGIFTHFPKSMDDKETNEQFNRFMNVLNNLDKNNIKYGLRHVCASTSFLKYSNMWLDAVRLGSVIQGRVMLKKDLFKKVGIFKTSIEEIKVLPKGYFVSYGSTYKTNKETKVAIVPVGYEDGYNKFKARDDFSLKNNIIAIGMEIKKLFKDNSLKVRINNKYYKIIGRLGMFYSVIDITDSNNINEGDEVEMNISPLQANGNIRRIYN